MRSQLKKVTSVILCVCMLMSILAITSFADGTTATISFADKANRTAYSTDQQIWVQNGITVTNDKGESTSNVGDYANPGRFYKSSTFKIEYPGMTKIEIDCTGMDAKYVKAWTDSFEGATENGGIVTVEFAQAVDSASVKMAAQGRANSITVYTAAGSEEGGEVEDDESYKDTYTHVDGVNVGTIQQLGDAWADKLTLDFWYLVEDGETTVTVNYAVDNKVVLDDDTMFRVWVDADITDTARTTLYDYKVSAGEAYNAKHASSINEAIVSAEYTVVGNDYFFTLVLDKATLGIDGEYRLNLQLGQSNSTTMHSIKYDNVTGEGATYAPWNTTEFYEVFGKEVKTTLTIEEAIALGESKEHNTYTEEKYYVTGVITSVYSEQYGNMYIEDENGNRLTIYGTYSADGELRYDAMEVKPVKGDTVTIYGRVGQYSGTAQIKNGWIVDHVPGEGDDEEEVPDPEADSTLTIEQAIALGASKDHNNYTSNKYYVTGVITEVYNEQYGNMKITDDNGNILTIYGTYSADGELRYDALEVKPVVGDTVTIYGIVGQYNDVAQVKNGWITAHTAASGNEASDDVSDESTEDDTPVLGDSGFVIEMVIVMVIALAAVAVVYRTKRRA